MWIQVKSRYFPVLHSVLSRRCDSLAAWMNRVLRNWVKLASTWVHMLYTRERKLLKKTGTLKAKKAFLPYFTASSTEIGDPWEYPARRTISSEMERASYPLLYKQVFRFVIFPGSLPHSPCCQCSLFWKVPDGPQQRTGTVPLFSLPVQG